VAGLHRGWTQSKVSLHGNERLFVDRFAWGAFYAGLYAWGHPIVFYCILQQLEMHGRRLCDNTYKQQDDPGILKILDVPHKNIYQFPCVVKSINQKIMDMSTEDFMSHAIKCDI
jgi:hypothetical protein